MGDACEEKVEENLKSKCWILVPLEKGADFLCIDNEEKASFIEAKCNKSQLTMFQKEFKKTVENLGIPYRVQRCYCSLKEGSFLEARLVINNTS
ncbi:MAG: hypothetical protein QXS27_07235 [Candidatus Jordarchaeaceae archaeon]